MKGKKRKKMSFCPDSNVGQRLPVVLVEKQRPNHLITNAQRTTHNAQRTTHNAQRTTHNAQRTTHNAQRTTHNAPTYLPTYI